MVHLMPALWGEAHRAVEVGWMLVMVAVWALRCRHDARLALALIPFDHFHHHQKMDHL